MRIFKTPGFINSNKNIGISDEALKDAVKNWNTLTQGNHPFTGYRGLSRLGGDVYKVELPLDNGRGRKTGARSVFCCKQGENAIFVYVFQKSEKDNIDDIDKESAQKLADDYFGTKSKSKKYDVDKMVEAKQLFEVK